ncbi:MAG: DUF2459 domain-containing protein [Gammaproteobacteria bacterium]|nr:DUF2459 domain-containing protein [Gammaproteobacteria bacterium]
MSMLKLLSGWLLTLIVIGCTGSPDQQAAHTAGEKQVYVVSHGWHTGIVIAGRDLGPELAFLDGHFDTARWYEIGWGDKQFYQAGEVTAALALRAGLLPTEAVLHVTALPERPDAYFTRNRVIELRIDAASLARLTTAVADYFKYDDNGEPITSGKGLYGQSLFFDATGRFHALNTCNTWTARILSLAGVPIRTFMTVRAGSVMEQLEPAAVSDTGER